ncbi:MAG: LemA family protein [Desulfobacterota bacterium]|jgi:LemA protein|nr:LemA family protein [Thermodesulfobacteriota bacterium]
MGNTARVIIGIVVAAVLIAGFAISGFNKARRLNVAVSAQWAQVENQLKRRFDLIPNLVETVKGYAAQEKTIFLGVAEARKAYFSAPDVAGKARAAGELEGALSRLLLLQERYPELKSNENFMKLQDSLEGTENRIAVERKRYNDQVRELNTYAATFPGMYFTSWAGVKEAQYFEVPEAETAVPQVKF